MYRLYRLFSSYGYGTNFIHALSFFPAASPFAYGIGSHFCKTSEILTLHVCLPFHASFIKSRLNKAAAFLKYQHINHEKDSCNQR